MRHAPTVLLSAFLAIGIFACGVTESPVRSGSSGVTQGTYANDYFGLTLPIPDEWFVASEETGEFFREVGRNLLGDNPALEAAVEASRKTTFQLLMLSKFEVGAAVEFNPNLILVAERVSHMPGIKSGKDYLFHTSKMLLETELPYELITEAHSTQLGGREWHRTDFVINQPEEPIEQAYFAVKHKDFVLAVILTATTEEEMVALERIANSITF